MEIYSFFNSKDVADYLREIGYDEMQDLLRFLQVDNEARRLRRQYDGCYDEECCPDGVWKRIKL